MDKRFRSKTLAEIVNTAAMFLEPHDALLAAEFSTLSANLDPMWSRYGVTADHLRGAAELMASSAGRLVSKIAAGEVTAQPFTVLMTASHACRVAAEALEV